MLGESWAALEDPMRSATGTVLVGLPFLQAGCCRPLPPRTLTHTHAHMRTLRACTRRREKDPSTSAPRWY